MEKEVTEIVFRRMTYADFRHINKVGGEEEGGGGQSYIDFPTAKVSIPDWTGFFGPPTGEGAAGPQWDVRVRSLGLREEREVRIYQRRGASVCIASQKIQSRESNRVPSWHPDNGFPSNYNPEENHLVIYIIKTGDGEFWAGWFLQSSIPKGWDIQGGLEELFVEESAGIIRPSRVIKMDTRVTDWPFYTDAREASTDVDEHLEKEDTSKLLDEIKDSNLDPQIVERMVRMRERSGRIVKNLKLLYGGKCQLTGEKFGFRKKDGEPYCEVHHLIPLGEEGSDSYANTVVVNPLIHRMLHYAKVEGLDLTHVRDNKLEIKINDETFVISWHPDHAHVIKQSLGGDAGAGE